MNQPFEWATKKCGVKTRSLKQTVYRRKGSTQALVHPHIKVTNANHMSMMKTSLTIIPMCPRERFPLYKSLSRLVLRYKKGWATLLHLVYFCYLLPIMNYLITKLSVTDNFSACRETLAENRL